MTNLFARSVSVNRETNDDNNILLKKTNFDMSSNFIKSLNEVSAQKSTTFSSSGSNFHKMDLSNSGNKRGIMSSNNFEHNNENSSSKKTGHDNINRFVTHERK